MYDSRSMKVRIFLIESVSEEEVHVMIIEWMLPARNDEAIPQDLVPRVIGATPQDQASLLSVLLRFYA